MVVIETWYYVGDHFGTFHPEVTEASRHGEYVQFQPVSCNFSKTVDINQKRSEKENRINYKE